MKKFTVLFTSLLLLLFSSLAFADDLTLTFDTNADVANWSHHDEANVWTVEEWDATGGVGGGGALKLTDAGYTILAKRAITSTIGNHYKLTIDINVATWGTGDLTLSVQGLSTVEPSVIVSGYSGYQTFTLSGTADLSASGYIRLHSLGSTTAPVVFVDNVVFDDDVAGPDLFFSEYIEGSYGNNKGFEIYNPTEAPIDLAGYQIAQASNGGGWKYYHIFPEGASIAAGDVWVITTNEIDPALFDTTNADEKLAFPSVTHHNGDDARAIIKIVDTDTMWLDIIGDPDNDPGSGWDVAGVAAATANHTLVRKESVTMGNPDWTASAGTNADDSEWTVYDADTWDYMGAHPGMPQGPVNVTFRSNVSRIYGLVDSTDTVDLRGSLQGWTANANPMNSDGGDYWSLEWTFAPEEVGTTVYYKYGGNIVNIDGIVNNQWENDLPGALPVSDRSFVVPATDTVLPIDYVGHSEGAPFVDDPDSLDVWFRVNMSTNATFNPETDAVHIAGSMEGWSHSIILSREGDSDYWSGQYKVGAVSDNPVEIYYKFTLGDWSGTHESRSDRYAKIHQDTTLQFVYYNDVMPSGSPTGTDTTQVHFLADLTRAINENGFSIGDTLIIQYGYNQTAEQVEDTLINVFGTNQYDVTVEVQNVTLGENLEYAYFAIKNGTPIRDKFYDFTDSEQSSQQNRKIMIPLGTGKTDVVNADDIIDSDTDIHRVPTFRNTSPISHNVTVTFTCDVRPAYYQLLLDDVFLDDIQGSLDVYEPDSVIAWGVAINGPATGGWGNSVGTDWGPHLMTLDNKAMYDDGTHGDMTAGDSIYSIQFFYSPDSGDAIGQEFKFGIGGGDNEPGQGGYGLNHFENIDDSQSQYTIHSDFGSINPPFYSKWDFDTHSPVTGLEDESGVSVIRTPRLYRNYPNPFNPVTSIQFEIEKEMDVKLVIYDSMGRKVRTLLNGKQNRGAHKVLWSGTNDHGSLVSSGVYFYRLITENYDQTMKMVLMK